MIVIALLLIIIVLLVVILIRLPRSEPRDYVKEAMERDKKMREMKDK